MRKALVVATAALAALAVISPAQAATKNYVISSVKVEVYDGGTYHRWSDIDLSQNHRDDKVRISGKVTGGPSPSKGFSVYAYNTDLDNKKSSVDKITISSNGSFKIYHQPDRAGRIKYVIKKSSRGSYRAATSVTKYVNAFAFFPISLFYDNGSGNLPEPYTPLVRGPITSESGNDADNYGQRINGYIDPPDGPTEPTRYSTMYTVKGGATMSVDVSGYRCKKFATHAGISDKSPQSAGSYAISLDGTPIPKFSGSRLKSDPEDTDTIDEPVFDKVTFTVDPLDPVEDDPDTEADETVHSSDVRFLFGRPLVFCTYPHVAPR